MMKSIKIENTCPAKTSIIEGADVDSISAKDLVASTTSAINKAVSGVSGVVSGITNYIPGAGIAEDVIETAKSAVGEATEAIQEVTGAVTEVLTVDTGEIIENITEVGQSLIESATSLVPSIADIVQLPDLFSPPEQPIADCDIPKMADQTAPPELPENPIKKEEEVQTSFITNLQSGELPETADSDGKFRNSSGKVVSVSEKDKTDKGTKVVAIKKTNDSLKNTKTKVGSKVTNKINKQSKDELTAEEEQQVTTAQEETGKTTLPQDQLDQCLIQRQSAIAVFERSWQSVISTIDTVTDSYDIRGNVREGGWFSDSYLSFSYILSRAVAGEHRLIDKNLLESATDKALYDKFSEYTLSYSYNSYSWKVFREKLIEDIEKYITCEEVVTYEGSIRKYHKKVTSLSQLQSQLSNYLENLWIAGESLWEATENHNITTAAKTAINYYVGLTEAIKELPREVQNRLVKF